LRNFISGTEIFIVKTNADVYAREILPKIYSCTVICKNVSIMNQDIIFLRFRVVFEKFARITAQQVSNRGMFKDFIANKVYEKICIGIFERGRLFEMRIIYHDVIYLSVPRFLFVVFLLSFKERKTRKKSGKGHLEIMEILRTEMTSGSPTPVSICLRFSLEKRSLRLSDAELPRQLTDRMCTLTGHVIYR